MSYPDIPRWRPGKLIKAKDLDAMSKGIKRGVSPPQQTVPSVPSSDVDDDTGGLVSAPLSNAQGVYLGSNFTVVDTVIFNEETEAVVGTGFDIAYTSMTWILPGKAFGVTGGDILLTLPIPVPTESS